MDKSLIKARESALDYIEKLTRDGDMTGSKAEALFYATGVVKNVCKLEHMEDGESYAESDGGNSGARRNRMGQFSRNGSRSYDSSRSPDSGHDEMMETLGRMMRNADGEQRRALERCMQELGG